jgi:anionic cell wall polymer biosynthesis LytR-Cps2A-Psr (LCP) family protein
MKPFSFDKSSIFLLLIIAVVVGLMVALGFALRSDAVDDAMKSDRIMNVLFVLELDRKPASSELFCFYPATSKGAILDVPAETGLIIKSLNRVDRIDALYDPRRAKPYVDEISRLLGADVPYWIVIDEKGLSEAADILDGLEVFVPSPIEAAGPRPVRLPSGALLLDGDKITQFASYKNPDETESDAATRRQKLLQSLLKRTGERAGSLKDQTVFSAFKRCFRTNLSDESLSRLFEELGKLDTDRLLLQRVTGVYRTVDGKKLLFPHYDGELVRDIVKQTLNALSSTGGGNSGDTIYTVEILNGTPSKGVAKRTAEIYQSFGYDVVSVGNADREDYDKTQVLDRFSNPEAAKTLGAVIRCSAVVEQGVSSSSNSAAADFTIVLGDDFDGRYCAK